MNGDQLDVLDAAQHDLMRLTSLQEDLNNYESLSQLYQQEMTPTISLQDLVFVGDNGELIELTQEDYEALQNLNFFDDIGKGINKLVVKGLNDVGKVTKKIFGDGSSTAASQADLIQQNGNFFGKDIIVGALKIKSDLDGKIANAINVKDQDELKQEFQKIDGKKEDEPAPQTNPVEPSKPAEPVKPVEPAKPAEPIKPVEPTKPADPISPVKPNTTVPINPAVPVKPVVPSQPFVPSTPAEFIKPVVPSQSADNLKPSALNTTLPIQPTALNTTLPIQPPALNTTLPIQPPVLKPRLPTQPPALNTTLPTQPSVLKPAQPSQTNSIGNHPSSANKLVTVYIDPSMRPVGFNLPLMASLIPQENFQNDAKQANHIGRHFNFIPQELAIVKEARKIPQEDFSAVMKQANSIGDNFRAVANGGARQPQLMMLLI